MLKIIFLDIDGVCNGNNYFNSEEFWSQQLIIGLPYAEIDPLKIKLINKLVEQSGAIVIISSYWRIQFSIETLNDILLARGASFHISGATPIREPKPEQFLYSPRGDEIQDYLNKICIKPEHFVILDDNNDMGHLSDHLILTNPDIGITEEDVERALKLLEET